MIMMPYKAEIFYSEEDEGYIAAAPDLPHCSAFGETIEEAEKEIEIAISLWLETAKEIGKDISANTTCHKHRHRKLSK
jgi:predicted RNase H-like HicB family nuclease